MGSRLLTLGQAICLLTAFAVALVASCGCNSRPTAVQAPQYDPEAFATSLLQRHDPDGNGTISKQEAAQMPGLVAAWARYDNDGMEGVSHADLAARAQGWLDRRDGIVAISCVVRLAGSQIGDVHVKLIPDESIAGVVQPAEAVSRRDRPSHLSIPPEFKPEAHRNLSGMQYGLYRVEVSHPTMQIAPAAQSTGCDIGPADQASPVVIHVERKQ
jgi:hypothetical protein